MAMQLLIPYDPGVLNWMPSGKPWIDTSPRWTAAYEHAAMPVAAPEHYNNPQLHEHVKRSTETERILVSVLNLNKTQIL